MLVSLCFIIQGFQVYGDRTHGRYQKLDEQAFAGLKLWRSQNCQACHQIHGFGGLLGPDLTNVVQRMDPNILQRFLTVGNRQMPAFHLTLQEINQIWAFLAAIDLTGTGYPSALNDLSNVTFTDLVRKIDEISSMNSEVIKRAYHGTKTMQEQGCNTCHLPFRNHIGPDLTLTATRWSGQEIRQIILRGRGRMPGFNHLSTDAANDIAFVLQQFRDHRQGLVELQKRRPVADYIRELPWFEYRN